MPIDVVLFDLGNVILPFDNRPVAEKLARVARRPEGRDPAAVFSYLFDMENGAINPYERGEETSEAFFESVKTRFDLTITLEEFAPIWNEIFEENEEVSGIVRALKGRKRLGLLSNTNALHFGYILENYPVLAVFDRWILSHEVGSKKPAREIFEAALAWAAVPAERVLFIDDIARHVEAARALGMKGILFTTADELQAALGDLLLRET